MPNRLRPSYANVVSTFALFLALGSGVALAADRIHSGDIAPGAVRTSDVFKRAIVSGKLALGAVRSNQLADGAVNSAQIANGAVGSKQVGAGAVAPSNLQFPVFYAASPSGGPAPLGAELAPYPMADNTWTQSPGEINVVFGAAIGTLAYDGSGSGSCRVFFELKLNGQQVGGGEIATESTTPRRVEGSLGAQPQIDPTTPTANQLTARAGANDCTPDSTIESTRFRVLDFG